MKYQFHFLISNRLSNHDCIIKFISNDEWLIVSAVLIVW